MESSLTGLDHASPTYIFRHCHGVLHVSGPYCCRTALSGSACTSGCTQREFLRHREVTKGALDALLASHYSVDVLSEHQILPRLGEFPVIVVPNACKLTDACRQSLLNDVDAGGGLILLGARCAKLFERDLGVQFAGGPNQVAELTGGDGSSVAWTDGWQHIVNASAKVICERSVTVEGQPVSEPAATVVARGKGRIAAVFGPVALKFSQWNEWQRGFAGESRSPLLAGP